VLSAAVPARTTTREHRPHSLTPLRTERHAQEALSVDLLVIWERVRGRRQGEPRRRVHQPEAAGVVVRNNALGVSARRRRSLRAALVRGAPARRRLVIIHRIRNRLVLERHSKCVRKRIICAVQANGRKLPIMMRNVLQRTLTSKLEFSLSKYM